MFCQKKLPLGILGPTSFKNMLTSSAIIISDMEYK